MLNYEFPPVGGGAGKAHQSLLRQYADTQNLKIDVLTSAPKPGFFDEKFSANITVYKVGVHKKSLHHWRKTEVIEWLLKARSHYRRLVQNNDYAFAHAFFGFPTGWLCYRTANKLPYIISLRGSDVPGKHARLQLDYKILGPVFKLIWKNAAALVACSEGLKNRALSFLPSVSIDVIPNGVDLEQFYPAQTNQKTETLKLLTVGRLSVTKRVEILIDVAELLSRQGFKLHLTIVGGGDLENNLRKMVLQKELGNIVEITGRIESKKMPQLYRQNHIFISATIQEGMSNAMLEAMASGLPIVTTPCEGVKELIADNGIVVKQASKESIANAIKSIADNEKLHNKMCFEARKQAENFSWKYVADKYLNYYNGIVNSITKN